MARSARRRGCKGPTLHVGAADGLAHQGTQAEGTPGLQGWGNRGEASRISPPPPPDLEAPQKLSCTALQSAHFTGTPEQIPRAGFPARSPARGDPGRGGCRKTGPGESRRSRPACALSLAAAPGLARRPSPWKRRVHSAVNMNFPSSRQPRRRPSARGPARPPPSAPHRAAPARGLGAATTTTPVPGGRRVSRSTLAPEPSLASPRGPRLSGRVREAQGAGAAGP